jgi:hypothetical protein
MAAKNSSKPKLSAVSTPQRKGVSLEDRAHIALRATWQLSQILAAIVDLARKNEYDEMPVDGTLLALAMRATDLNNLISQALGDELETVARLESCLNEDDADTAEAAHG